MSLAATPLRRLFTAKGWASALFVVAVGGVFFVSEMALAAIGINYDSVGGAMWQKLHPATYAASLAIAFDILARARPVAHVKHLLAKFPGATFFLANLLLLIVYAVLVQQTPITSLIEPYVIAIVALFMYDDIAPDTRELLRRFLHTLLFVNAVIGLLEFATHLRLFPYVISGEPVEGDYRSTAMLGHPLSNASTTGAYVLCLFFGGDSALTPMQRTMLMVPQILVMAAFGGRTAILASSLIIGASLLKGFALLVVGTRFDIRRLLTPVVVAPLILSAVAFAVSVGLLDEPISRFVDDNGSAEARVTIMRLFSTFEFGDLMLGPKPDLVNSALSTLGIEIGIENTWIALIFQYGALMTLFFVLGLLALFWEFWRQAHSGATLLFIYFFIIISSSTGLSAKTMIFVHFALLLLFLFHRVAAK